VKPLQCGGLELLARDRLHERPPRDREQPRPGGSPRKVAEPMPARPRLSECLRHELERGIAVARPSKQERMHATRVPVVDDSERIRVVPDAEDQLRVGLSLSSPAIPC
jgi:hypothetical protein